MTGEVRFEVYRAPAVILTKLLRGGDDWCWRFCDPQGTVIARSDGYRTREDCLAAVEALQRRAASAKIVDLSRKSSAHSG